MSNQNLQPKSTICSQTNTMIYSTADTSIRLREPSNPLKKIISRVKPGVNPKPKSHLLCRYLLALGIVLCVTSLACKLLTHQGAQLTTSAHKRRRLLNDTIDWTMFSITLGDSPPEQGEYMWDYRKRYMIRKIGQGHNIVDLSIPVQSVSLSDDDTQIQITDAKGRQFVISFHTATSDEQSGLPDKIMKWYWLFVHQHLWFSWLNGNAVDFSEYHLDYDSPEWVISAMKGFQNALRANSATTLDNLGKHADNVEHFIRRCMNAIHENTEASAMTELITEIEKLGKCMFGNQNHFYDHDVWTNVELWHDLTAIEINRARKNYDDGKWKMKDYEIFLNAIVNSVFPVQRSQIFNTVRGSLACIRGLETNYDYEYAEEVHNKAKLLNKLTQNLKEQIMRYFTIENYGPLCGTEQLKDKTVGERIEMLRKVAENAMGQVQTKQCPNCKSFRGKPKNYACSVCYGLKFVDAGYKSPSELNQ